MSKKQAEKKVPARRNGAAVAQLAPVKLLELDVALLQDSKTNPRRSTSKDQDDELAESIRQHGVLQPLVVRAGKAGTYEVVCGSRRLHAARWLGIKVLPCALREFADEQDVRTVQLVENLQREGVAPLEEAQGFRELVDAGLAVEQLVARVGRSRSYVFARLQLLKLPAPVQGLLTDGKLDLAIAQLAMRIADPKRAADFAREAAHVDQWDGAMTYRQAAQLLEREYLLDLTDAPFPTGDAELVSKAGSCAACPKRTGNQRDLFGEIDAGGGGKQGSPELCSDGACWRAKVEAHGKRLADAARAAGGSVLKDAAAKAAVENARHWRIGDRKHLRLDEDVPGGRQTWRALLDRARADGAALPAPVVALTKEGAFELVPREATEAALAAANIKMPKQQQAGQRKSEATKREEKERAAARKVDREKNADAKDQRTALLAALPELLGHAGGKLLELVDRVIVEALLTSIRAGIGKQVDSEEFAAASGFAVQFGQGIGTYDRLSPKCWAALGKLTSPQLRRLCATAVALCEVGPHDGG
jgi:ParB/RepB/Spo0J family partition protein